MDKFLTPSSKVRSRKEEEGDVELGLEKDGDVELVKLR